MVGSLSNLFTFIEQHTTCKTLNNLLSCRYIKQIRIMENISIAFQLIVAISVLIVWIFRYDNIVVEFKHYGYSDLLRNFVGVSKTSTSTLLILGIWYNEITIYASLSMAFFMLCAQVSHIKVKNPFIKFVPSLIFLIMSLFIASFNCGLI